MTDEKDYNPTQVAERWLQELKMAKREDEKWVKRGKKIIRRCRDDRQGYSDTAKRYNILWSNVQTLFPSMYGRTPQAQVERRFKDQDPVGLGAVDAGQWTARRNDQRGAVAHGAAGQARGPVGPAGGGCAVLV